MGPIYLRKRNKRSKTREVFAAGARDIITPELIEEVYGLPVTIAEINGMPCVVPGDGTDHIYNHGP